MICISSLSEVVVDIFASDVVDTIVGLKIWPFIVELTAEKNTNFQLIPNKILIMEMLLSDKKDHLEIQSKKILNE